MEAWKLLEEYGKQEWKREKQRRKEEKRFWKETNKLLAEMPILEPGRIIHYGNDSRGPKANA